MVSKGFRLFVAVAMLATMFTSTFTQRNTLTAAAEVGIPSLPFTYNQNFDTLLSTGTTNPWTDDTTIIGWYSSRTVYSTTNGASTAGALYSLGTTAASERALGSLASGTTGAITTGLRLKNNSASPITTLVITYTGEQWRNGGNINVQKLDFSYQIGATVTSLTSGTWTDVNGLDFLSLINTATAAALDGNIAANRTTLSATVSVNIPAGEEVMLRWSDINDSGSDHALGIDDVSITAQGSGPVVDNAPAVASTVPNTNATGVALNSNITLTFTEPVTTTGSWYTISCATSGAHAAVVSGGPTSYTLNPAADFVNNELCTVTVVAAQVTDLDGTPNAMAADYTWTFTTTGVVPDVAPTVVSTTPISGAVNIAIDSNLTINFSEAVTATLSSFTISCATSGAHAAVLGGGPTSYTLNPAVDFANGELCTATVVAAQVTDQDGTPDQMAQNYSWSFTTIAAGACPIAPTTTIPAVQGTGLASPVAGSTVRVQGVVTAVFPGLSGFFMQDVAGDANAATSDGLFIFNTTAVITGNLVSVNGTVAEFRDATQIGTGSTVTVCGTATVPAPIVLDLPVPTLNGQEAYEGMYVSIPETFTVDQNYFLGRYGQLTVSAEGRVYNPTNNNLPGSPAAIAEADLNARRMLVLDDGRSAQNINPIPYIGLDNTVRAGDTFAGLTGILNQGPINTGVTPTGYNLQPTVAPVFTRANPRTAAPEAVGGNVKVSSFNVLNYFNGDGAGGGFPTSRGASSVLEFNRQRVKIIKALVAINADVVGLMEIENDGDGATSAVQDLVNGLNAELGAGTYSVVPSPAPGTDAIRVSMIYKPGRVTRVGAAQNYQVTTNPTYNPLFDRPPFAQTFSLNSNGEKFSVIVNHFKSKSCGTPAPVGVDADQGQGCWNAKRTAQAQNLLNFINDIKTSAADNDVLVIGDLNAYGKEDPITTLISGGLTNEIAIFIANAYSFVFDGAAGYLDHALTSSSLAAQVTGVTEWHINADEPSVIDYNVEFKNTPGCTSSCLSPDLYTPTPYRASDHDPVIIGLQLGGNLTPASFVGSSKTVNATNVVAGSYLTYTLTITNSGQTAATFNITDTLNANLQYIGSTPSMTVAGQQLTASGSIAGNQQKTYVITVKVSAAFVGTLNNSFSLTGDGTSRSFNAQAVTVTVAQNKIFLPLIIH